MLVAMGSSGRIVPYHHVIFLRIYLESTTQIYVAINSWKCWIIVTNNKPLILNPTLNVAKVVWVNIDG